ncbi:MAG TPA: hypothetical protein VEV87_04305 [Chitinophagaceae bacterium]|nr:hypothetical protein [Chitinophagaceae bacterium]
MKTMLLLLIFFFFFLEHGFYEKKVQQPENTRSSLQMEIDFKTQIQPILQKRCSPCHFPGGKMYEKLPFDTAATLLLKKESILKRIKEDPDNKLLREFIEQNEK